MRKPFLTASICALALALHFLLGWIWTPVAGVIGGFVGQQSGWKISAIGLGLSWSILVFYNLIVANAQVIEMGRVLGELFGGLPGTLVFVFTAIIGLLLGAISGVLGSSLRPLIGHKDRTRHGSPS